MDNKIFFSACRLLALGMIFVSSISGCKAKTDEETDAGQEPPYEKVLLDHFPVSLDFLFRIADPARHNQILNGIRNGRPESSMLFLVPYPNYHHNSHFPATLKWYLYTGGHMAISMPLPRYL